MSPKYQVFLSSTFTDLQEERKAITEAVLDLDHIPSGMELFPAADEEQFEYISNVIDDSDYYLLVIGGRYGSTTASGLSYTEREYDYAVSKDKVVLAFLHSNIDELPVMKTERDPDARFALESFRERVKEGRIVKFWSNKEQLRQIVTTSLARAIRTYPRPGWVRGGEAVPAEVLTKLQDALSENERLKARIDELEAKPMIDDLADMLDEFQINYTCSKDLSPFHGNITLRWHAILSIIGPWITVKSHISAISEALQSFIRQSISATRVVIYKPHLDQIVAQFEALRLIEVSEMQLKNGELAPGVQLTHKGKSVLMENLVVRNR